MAIMYRAFSKDYTVYMFSRRNHLPAGYTTLDMARDLKNAMDMLGIGKADLMGVSMGGMIAQHFAADYPKNIGKLVLVATCAESNPVLNESVQEWIHLAKHGNHAAFMDSSLRRMYSDTYCRKKRWILPFIGKLAKPKSYDRFFIQADACLTHTASNRLSQIAAETLVIGGGQDHVLGANSSRQIAALLPHATLRMYPELGHALYEEARDFNRTVLDFLQSEPI